MFFTVNHRKMSTARLRINKFEDGCNFKSLYVTIPDDEHQSNVRFSEWTEGTATPKKKDSEKSSRLVVRIVSGEVSKWLDLDSCSYKIEDKNASLNDFSYNGINAQTDSLTDNSGPSVSDIYPTGSCEYRTDTLTQSNDTEFTDPLDKSLQKVKENNARIMEKINMLNRTLNYTKNREMMGLTCTKSMRTYLCTTCGKCFVYETGLRRHYSMRHAVGEMQPRWQTVWTCIQCFQVWPSQDQAKQHSIECCKTITENQETVREIKTSLLLQCEFCEKVFTSIPRLLRHSKIHTTASNYECNSCRFSFVSYKMAEQHRPLCPWQNSYYCFSLPKMLLCNACDRKFRNYDQLYNHRYKAGHFITKTHNAVDSVKTLGMLVYQCELCVQWYTNVLQMISHRSQCHPYNDARNYNYDDNFGNENSEDYYLPAQNENDSTMKYNTN